MKRKLFSLLTAASMLVTLFSVSPFALADDSYVSAKDIKLGDYVQIGQVDGTTLLWRCVGFEKITGTDADGNPVVDSTQTVREYQEGYLPLMFVAAALPRSGGGREFDSAGTVAAGSHGRDPKDPGAANARKTDGSNYWPDSNIRDWLTSAAGAGEVEWSCGNPPSYKNNSGFLNQFTTLEKKAIQKVVLPSVLDEFDQELADNGGTELYRMPAPPDSNYERQGTVSINDLTDGREAVLPSGRFYSKMMEETVFLLDVQQFWNIYQNRDVLGNRACVPENAGQYFLRTPCLRQNESYSDGRSVVNGGSTDSVIIQKVTTMYKTDLTRARLAKDVCPAFYLNVEGFLAGGDGSKGSPYVPSLGDHVHDLFYCPPTSPTCTEKGTEGYWTCNCGLMFADAAGNTEIMAPTAVAATGHSWGDWEVDKMPTLTEKGKLGRGCLTDPAHRDQGDDIPPLNDTQFWTREILRPATTKAAGIEKYTSSLGTVEWVTPKLGPEGESVLKLGDYVQLGQWNGDPILWRCVGFEKIAGTDGNGNPVMDSAQTVTAYQEGYLPLLFADSALCARQFDSYGSNEAGSHARNLEKRKWAQTGGSSFWADSNLRDWLNSEEARGKVVYTCGNPPTRDSDSSKPGFLHDFSELEKTAILPVTQRCIVSPADQTEADAGSGDYTPAGSGSISDMMNGSEAAYNAAWSMQVTDKVFCLDLRQMSNVYANRNVLGEKFHLGGQIDSYYFGYWLRTPAHDTGSLTVGDSGSVYTYPADYKAGARPALYLSADTCLGQGDGTKGTPFLITQDGPAVKDRAEEPDIQVPAPVVELKPGTPAVEAQGVEELAAALYEKGGSGEVTLTVEQLSPAEVTTAAAAIRVLSGEQELYFLDITLLHGDEPLHEVAKPLKFIIPYDTANKKDFRVYRYHDGQAQEISGAPGQGEYFVVEEGKIILYAEKFSVYTVGYTPVTEEPPSTGGDISGGGQEGGDPSDSGSQEGGSSSGNNSSSGSSYAYVDTASLVKGDLSSGEVPVGALLTLKPKSNSVSIRYTTDGTRPSLRSAVYEKPISIEKDMTVKVAAVRGGVLGSVVTYAYTVAAPTAASKPGTFRADASSLRYIRGYEDGSFRPNQAATRYEAVEALANLVTVGEGTAPHPFSDVDPAYADTVSKLVRSGLIKGMTPDTFQGEGTMTRCQLCKVLVLALELTPGSGETGFSDTAGHWAAPYISALAQAGYINGYTDGTFRPDLPVTRAELAALLNRAAGRKNVSGTAPTFRDVSGDFWGYEDIQSAALGQ